MLSAYVGANDVSETRVAVALAGVPWSGGGRGLCC